MSSTVAGGPGTPTLGASGDEPAVPRASSRRSWRSVGIGRTDAVIMSVLVLAAVVPRYVLPPDGFFFDDAWQAAGAVKGSISDLPLVGQTQPGFTALLMVVTGVFGTSDLALMGPTLVAGSIGPAVLYAVVHRLGSSRAVAVLTAAALVASELHIRYSGRVKTYTIDILVVLALVGATGLLARRAWNHRTATGWVLAAVAVASLSTTSLMVAGCAGAVLALHPCDDRRWRWGALAGQGAASGALLLVARRSVSTEAIADFFRERNGMIGHDDPLSVPRRTAAHLFHAGESLVDLPSVGVGIVMAMSLVGLAAMALTGRHVVVGRFLVLCLTVVVVGSIAGLVPMGSPSSDIDRVNLWLFPVLAIGFARSASFLVDLCPTDVRLRASGVALTLALVLGWRGINTDVAYPLAGARTAAAEVLGDLDDRTVVWVTRYQVYGFALEGDEDVRVVRQTHRNVGFAFDYEDPRILAVLHGTTDAELSATLTPDVDRVQLVSMDLPPDGENRTDLSWHLALSGFELSEERDLEGSRVATWVRAAAP